MAGVFGEHPGPDAIMIPMIGGTHANLKIDPGVVTAVEGAESEETRSIKVEVVGEKLVAAATLKASASIDEDFAAAASSIEDAKPCLVLMRVKGVSSIPASTEWAMLAWSPDDAPVRQRTLFAGSKKTVQEKFDKIAFASYHATSRDEFTLAAFLETVRPPTDAERRAAMTQAEIDLESVKKEQEQERASAPKMLAGLVALKIKVQPGFEESMTKLLAEEGTAVVARLVGATNEELDGEVLDGIASPAALKGKLPAEPCYVLMRACGEKRLLLLSWLPEDANVKLRMKTSTFKASTIDKIKELASEWTVAQSEVTAEEDLVDDLAAVPVLSAAEPEAAPEKPKWKPPAGGMALPGMALPGMAKKPAGY